MQENINMPNWQAVAAHYDRKGKDDLNYLSATDKRIVHHHSGIFAPGDAWPAETCTEEELLHVLGESEDRLTHLGAKALETAPGRGFDCGCGRGGSSFILARDYGCDMTGITISPTQLTYARSMAEALCLEERVRFEQVNIFASLPAGWQGAFDFIWACESTEYMPNYPALFRIWYSLLKEEGKALLFAIAWRQSQRKLIEQELQLVDGIYETRIGRLHDYLAAAVEAGFVIDNYIDLAERIIPYYRLRLGSVHKRGSEEALIKGLESGAFRYFLLLLQKTGK